MHENKTIEHYNWLIDTLVKAYMDDTLVAGTGCGCALGNLIHAKVLEETGNEYLAKMHSSEWMSNFVTTSPFTMLISHSMYNKALVLRTKGNHVQIDRIGLPDSNTPRVRKILESLELPLYVIMDIEWEFETNQTGETGDEQMFNGLLACISVLDKYFGVDQLEQTKTRLSEVRQARELV